MNILVLNGSPKGEYSITLQTVKYIKKNAPECSLEILHVGQKIKALEKDFTVALEALERADMDDLLTEKGQQEALFNKNNRIEMEFLYEFPFLYGYFV